MQSDPTSPAGLSQRRRIAFLLKDSILYGGAAALSKAFALITFPLLARHFTVADYGVLDYFITLALVAALALIFGQDSAVARYFYEYEDRKQRSQIISQSLLIQIITVAAVVPILWVLSDDLTGWLLGKPELGRLMRAMLLQLPFLVVITFCQNLLKWTFARAGFLLMSLGFTVWQAGTLFVAVAVLDLGVEGVLLASALTGALFAGIGLFLVRSWLVIPQDLAFWKVLVPYAAPFGVICVLSALSPTLERTLTVHLLGEHDLGLYAAGAKIAMLIGLLVNAFQTAWGPFSLAIYKQQDAGVTYNWVFKHFSILACAATFGLSLAAPLLIAVLASSKFAGAVTVVYPLAMGLAIQATSWITEIGIALSKKSSLSLYGYGALVLSTLGAISLLAPVLGLAGVALGVMIGQATKAVVASVCAQSVHPLPWQFGRVVVLFALATGFGCVGLAAFTHGIWPYLGWMAAGLIGTLVVGWFLVLDGHDRDRLRPVLLLKGGLDGVMAALRGR